MSVCRKLLPVAMMALIGTASAEDAAKPAVPSFSSLMEGWGIKVNGYVDATYTAAFDDTNNVDYNSFQFHNAGLTVSSLPSSGFGGLVTVVAGQNPYDTVGFASTASYAGGNGFDKTNVYVLQGFVQYASGPLTIQLGKFGTLAGAEVALPTGNVNTTRSLLFYGEPVTHSGLRAIYAVNDTLSFTVGINNGWDNSQETADSSSKTGEFGFTFAPSKAFSWAGAAYYGYSTNFYGTKSDLLLLDTVLTFNVSDALSLVGSVDYASIGSSSTTPSASYYGVAAYVNYAFTSQWRGSLRAEYFNDKDGYLYGTPDQKISEVTLTVGYAPTPNYELRLEGRYDKPDDTTGLPKTYQGWIEAIYKF